MLINAGLTRTTVFNQMRIERAEGRKSSTQLLTMSFKVFTKQMPDQLFSTLEATLIDRQIENYNDKYLYNKIYSARCSTVI